MDILLKKGNFNGNRSVPSNFMSDSEYSVITSDVIKSFDCISFMYECMLRQLASSHDNVQSMVNHPLGTLTPAYLSLSNSR